MTHRFGFTDFILRARHAVTRRRGAPAVGLLGAVMLTLSGCGYSQGAFLYMMGFGQRDIVKAKFTLTKGPILILVDDPSGHVDWPPAQKYLIDTLSQELIKQGGADKIIPRRTVQNLRRSRTDFGKLSCREIGELVGAEQVLWLQVKKYFGDSEFFEPTNAAWFAVTVKVVDPLEKEDRGKVRLWPASPRGKYISVSLDGSEVAQAKTKDGIAKALAQKLAERLAKVFCDYRPGDFEREE